MTAQPDLLKIGEFARLAETNLRTLRYYEELGLLSPSHRSQGGFRYYRRTDVNRVHLIRDLQELGLQLERIRELISMRASGEPGTQFFARVRQALSEQDRMLAERERSIVEQRARIQDSLTKLTECQGCANSPCAQNNHCEPCSTSGEDLPDHLSALYQ
ncbi:MAG: MerR family transcriptional regulator [Planctomycetes bacterium]|nr:MerR family transcriptional regulator [Planctomycetota bacterium]